MKKLLQKMYKLYYDKLDEMIADKRIDNLKADKTTLISLEEVFKKARLKKPSKRPFYLSLINVPIP